MEQIETLAKLGFRLMPILTKNKVPILKDWTNTASSDIETVRYWEERYPSCNWGVLTGGDFFVVDIDPKHGGQKSWDAIAENVPTTVTVKTGTGGYHYYFEMPKDFSVGSTTNRIGKGIDTRGVGGQVIIPPSIHPSGNQYVWVHDPFKTKIAKAPAWLLQKLMNVKVDQAPSFGAEIQEGERNDAIYHHALQLARSGAEQSFTATAVRSWLKSINAEDISDAEIDATIASAYKKAKASAKKESVVFEKTDDDNARRLLQQHGEDLLYVPGLGWHHWDGKRWKGDPDNAAITGLVIDTMRTIRDEAIDDSRSGIKAALDRIKWANTSLNIGKITACIAIASTYAHVRKEADELDVPKYLLNCSNGTLDLRTGKLREHSKEDYLTKCIEIDYERDAPCPFWEETMALAFEGNTELIEFMQRALGYSLSGSTSEQCLFICWGPSGNNGKSTILETVQDIMGDYASMSDMVVITSSQMSNRVASSMARLQGTRLVSMNEAEENQKISEGVVKQLTGGDTVEACKKYKEPFTYKPGFKLWIRTNDKPTISGNGDAIWRRIKLIPFVHPIPPERRKRRDQVDALLRSEYAGILAWLVRGCMVWAADGLRSPKAVNAATSSYRSEMDMVRQFMDECILEGDWVARREVYRVFLAWCKDNGIRNIMSSASFGRRFAKKLAMEQTREKRGSDYVWLGVELTESAKIMGF
jgi:putative DNA primase/helicase